MSHVDANPGSSNDPPSRMFAKYMLVFSAFGLFVLAVIANKYEHRQGDVENRFHGIQQMQRDANGDDNRDGNADQSEHMPDQQPLIITLRPLMIVLGVVMMSAWLFVSRTGDR